MWSSLGTSIGLALPADHWSIGKAKAARSHSHTLIYVYTGIHAHINDTHRGIIPCKFCSCGGWLWPLRTESGAASQRPRLWQASACSLQDFSREALASATRSPLSRALSVDTSPLVLFCLPLHVCVWTLAWFSITGTWHRRDSGLVLFPSLLKSPKSVMLSVLVCVHVCKHCLRPSRGRELSLLPPNPLVFSPLSSGYFAVRYQTFLLLSLSSATY